jgi:PhnB protein
MHLNTYLQFNGSCEAAFKFYEQCLGGKIEAITPYEGSPAGQHVPAEWRKTVLHARLAVNGQVLMGSDVPPTPHSHYDQPKGFSVSIEAKDPAEAERLFRTLAENGQVQMPVQETFWAVRFGMCVDRFGIPWIVNCSKAS